MTSAIALERAAATALRRVELSRPIRLALESSVIRPEDTVFDYGCGHGDDIDFLTQLGHIATGWDPNHHPDGEMREAAVVNLGYVLNVIEEPAERLSALRAAWKLARRALVVAVRTTNETQFVSKGLDHADGLLTGADTFQRFFGQAEARAYIDDVLETQSIPLALGVFVAFKSEDDEQEWLENRDALRRRVRRLRRIVEPRKTLRDKAYDEHRDVIRPLEEFLAERGRLPREGEESWIDGVEGAFGSVPRAFQVLRHVADEAWWEDAAEARRDDLRVRFALARLRKRPKFSALPARLQADVKALFGSYRRACEEADELLFSIGDPDTIKATAREASVGKLTPEALYVHMEATDVLPPELRVYLGAADAVVGSVPDATLVKLHLDKPRVSYLVYPDFQTDPHPALAESWVVDFRELDVRPHDYRGRANPPVLHRKELFVTPDYPRYDTFCRLSDHEERVGLLDEPLGIGTRDGWGARLAEAGWTLRGHRLVRAGGSHDRE